MPFALNSNQTHNHHILNQPTANGVLLFWNCQCNTLQWLLYKRLFLETFVLKLKWRHYGLPCWILPAVSRGFMRLSLRQVMLCSGHWFPDHQQVWKPMEKHLLLAVAKLLDLCYSNARREIHQKECYKSSCSYTSTSNGFSNNLESFIPQWEKCQFSQEWSSWQNLSQGHTVPHSTKK